ncbi:unnamed protein product [Enterobius vermicularis]|uniref:Methyltransferase HEMK2 n=1 Tax=Enterobius vermicularis TaxID=51028 RepID=A0A0N4VF46_ENTVE|nr:unnamed protein product [Enterobius vermicularis]
MLFSTPNYKLTDDDKNYVYDPAEDSFLLLDALEKDVQELRRALPTIAVEIGVGSGIVSTFLRQILEKPICLFATDVNWKALQCSKKTASLNRVDFELIFCDLSLPLNCRLQSAVDILVINPPYVNTDDPATSDLALSWCGGPTGRDALDRLMPLVPGLLSTTGVMYVVASKANNISHILTMNPGLSGTVVLERQCGSEHLYVLKFIRKGANEVSI